MRQFSHFISHKNNNIHYKTSINAQRPKEDKIKTIIKTRLLKNQHIITKSIQKRKKLKDKFIPQNDILLYSYYKEDVRNKKEKKESKNNDKNEEEEKNIPFTLKILDFQKKMNKTNYLIKNLREENKMFHNGYQRALLMEQNRNKNSINIIENKRNNIINDLHKKNLFNQSLLLTKKKKIPDYILESLDNNESKEDLKLILSLKNNFKKGQSIIYPDFLNKEKDETEKLFKNIIKMKKENKLLEENISNYEKNLDSFREFDLKKDQTKELNLVQQKLSFIQNRESNNKLKLNLDDTIKAKSTKNVNPKLILSYPDSRGEYNLVTKCEIKDKQTPKLKNDIFKIYSKELKFKDFYDSYNKSKSLLNGSKKGKFTSDIINYNSNINNIKIKDRRQTLKKKFFYNQKYFDSLSSNLESFYKKNSKEKDILNLYSFMKKGNLMDVRDLMVFYKRKYGKDYELENVISGLKKHPEPYDLVNRINELDKLNNFVEIADVKKRKAILENVKQLDEQIKNGGNKFAKRILDFN